MSINELFNSLSARLAEIENNEFAKTEAYGAGDYYQLTRNIEYQSDSYPITESLKLIRYYLDRINNAIDRIEKKFPKEAIEIKRPIHIVVLDDIHTSKDKRKVDKIIPEEIYVLEELEYYRDRLVFMFETRKTFLTLQDSSDKKEIELPEKFSVKLLQAQFQPLLTSNQVALLLNYLNDQRIIPNYPKNHLASIAEYLFAKSGQDIRTALSNVHTPSVKTKENLGELKRIFTLILKELEEDIKSSK